MIAAVFDGNDVVNDYRRWLSPFSNFTIAADVAVATQDVLSLFRRNRPSLCFFIGHTEIIYQSVVFVIMVSRTKFLGHDPEFRLLARRLDRLVYFTANGERSANNISRNPPCVQELAMGEKSALDIPSGANGKSVSSSSLLECQNFIAILSDRIG